VNATTGAKLEASIRADSDDIHSEPDWTLSVMGVPAPRTTSISASTTMFWNGFKKNGKGYQTLMNNVLRAFVQTRRQGESIKSRTRSVNYNP